MRVLINMPSQHGGRHSGVALAVFRFLQIWLETTPDEYVLRSPWRREDLPEALRNSALTVVTIPRPRIMILDVLIQTFSVPSLCRSLGIDVLLNADPFGSARGARARVTLVHDLFFRALPEQFGARAALTMGLTYQWVLSGSDLIVTNSDATRTDLANWRPDFGAKACTVHLAVPSGSGAVSPDRTTDVPYVLLVGNATPNKNVQLAARTAALLERDFPALQLIHVGMDPGEAIRTALDQFGSGVALDRRSGLSDAELRSLYEGATCLFVPSLAEGFCIPILEAQDADCPVVCADISAMPEIAGDGAILFPSDDADAAARAIRDILTVPAVRQDLVTKGRANRARFSSSRSAEAFHDVLRAAHAKAVGAPA